jgi:hypothetical protein
MFESFVDADEEFESKKDNEKSLVKYEIFVKTSDFSNASTFANVYMQLFGIKNFKIKQKNHNEYKKNDKKVKELISVIKFPLEHSLNFPKSFQRGQVDKFVMKLEDIGDLERVRVGHNSSLGLNSGWHISQIMINIPSKQKKWCINCSKWLDIFEDDKKIYRDFLVDYDNISEIDNIDEYINQNDNNNNQRYNKNSFKNEYNSKNDTYSFRESNFKKKYINYAIKINTSSLSASNFDKVIKLKLMGQSKFRANSEDDRVETEFIKINSRLSDNEKRQFEKGQYDLFEFNNKDVGKVC